MENGREPRHPIRVVSERTGLSPDVLRAWEKRYGVVAPGRRQDAGQRLYSDADVERLRLLRRATSAGRSISHVATLPDAELARLVAEDETQRTATPARPPAANGSAAAGAHVRRALAAVGEMDGPALEAALRRAAVTLGIDAFVDDVAAPFLRAVGDAWASGAMSVAHEHLASAVLRRVLGIASDAAAGTASGPAVVIATPARQVHELGAMLAAAAATSAGWRVVYLGADLPAEDVARAVRETGARVVALSLVFAANPAGDVEELRRLRRLLPSQVALVAGGEGARAAAAPLANAGIRFVPDFAEFRRVLGSMNGRE
ncbi:MAG: MerR family transcriptional regulator [Gemmatimonadetes bacterium]|nr:MerR family transcriptional regulator [Gemmatimonadota bacterium]